MPLVNAIFFLINKYFVSLTWFLSKVLVYEFGIDLIPFWANLFLYFLESKHIKQLIPNGLPKAYEYDAVSKFIDDLRAINGDNEFLTSFKNNYPKKLDLKVERQGNNASFLDLDIKIEDCFRI